MRASTPRGRSEVRRTLGAGYEALDRFQQDRSWLGFPLAVWRKYGDDQGGYLAATISYYAFFSLFPLLLAATTILGFVLEGDQALQERILGTALAQFPVVGDQLKVGGLSGDPVALTVGVAIALWSGTSVFLAAETAMNRVWGVPFRKRPNAFRARGRAVVLVLLLGTGILAATALSFLGTFGSGYGTTWKIGSTALSTALDFGLFWAGYRVLTVADVGWRDTWLGAAVAAFLYQLVQALGSWYIDRIVGRASAVYGTFALVIGLLSWIYLGATILLYAGEVNIVALRRLWPRSLSPAGRQPPTQADERARAQQANIEEPDGEKKS